MKTVVLKFGGASVEKTDFFDRVAQIIQKKTIQYDAVVVVVSAMGKMTDQLIELAQEVHPNPPQREFDMLISVGERVSVSLLAMALDKRDVSAISFTGSQSGIITTSDHGYAKIVDVRPYRIVEALKKKQVVLVAGFQGVSLDKDITTLGRGGSDTSAVALAVGLEAERVEFYKDVLGIYNKDPHKYKNAILKNNLTYKEALDLNLGLNPILHPRSIELAQKNNLTLNILSFKNSTNPGTLIRAEKLKNNAGKIFEGSASSIAE